MSARSPALSGFWRLFLGRRESRKGVGPLPPRPLPRARQGAHVLAHVATIAQWLSGLADFTGILRVPAPQSALARKRVASIVLDRDGGEGLTHHDRNCPHRAAAAVHVCRV